MRRAEFEPLSEAEQAVIAGVGTGRTTVLGNGTLPGETAGEDRQVRASLIRWLALGAPGDESVQLHEKGLRIAGALVVSDGQVDPFLEQESTPGLDLEGCTLDHDLALDACCFQHAPLMLCARVQSLDLSRAALPGLDADGLEARGGVFLRGVLATGEVRLLDARISVDLECVDGQFETKGGKALSADRLEARGSVFLSDVHATGEVRLSGAKIGGDLECVDGQFETKGGNALNGNRLEVRGNVFLRRVRATGEVRLQGAQLGGNLECDGGCFENPSGKALTADGARITGGLFWREGSEAQGAIDLTAAEIGVICDDPACWPGPGGLLLDRCRYGAFIFKGISGTERIRWLDLQAPERWGGDFWPQPWEHCATVLREMGHAEDARQVLIAKEKRQRAANLARRRREVSGTWREMLVPVRLLRDGSLRALIAYGHKPLRAILWLAGLWLFGWAVFAAAHDEGGFKPNNAFILAKPEWAQCEVGGELRGDHPSTLDCYRAQPEAKGYPAFNALLYSADTLVPVVDLEVQDYWLPDEKAAPWARGYLWVHIGMGWFLALLAVAGFSGLVQTRATED